ncbi:MAG: putative transposase [Candidatus Azotimanducaceae bacterium]
MCGGLRVIGGLYLLYSGPSWLTFLGRSKDSLWSVDLFRCESIIVRSLQVMVVIDHYSRRIDGFAVHVGTVDRQTLCCMFNRTIAGIAPPPRLSSDNDPLFTFHRWQANLRILDVFEVKSVPYVPMSHLFIERLIGTIRQDFLDHVPFWGTVDLERKLEYFKEYYNTNRTHRALDGTSPAEISNNPNGSVVRLDSYRWDRCCRVLYQLPTAA